METILDIGSAVFALIAAYFWFCSAYVKIPPLEVLFGGVTKEDHPFYQGIKDSAALNKWAAASSGVSALCMGIKLLMISWPNLLGYMISIWRLVAGAKVVQALF